METLRDRQTLYPGRSSFPTSTATNQRFYAAGDHKRCRKSRRVISLVSSIVFRTQPAAFSIIWPTASELFGVVSGFRRKASQTRPNAFTNEQNQALTLKAERLSPLAKAGSSFPSLIRTWRIRQIPSNTAPASDQSYTLESTQYCVIVPVTVIPCWPCASKMSNHEDTGIK